MRQLKIQERITDRREKTIDKYLSELSGKKYDKLTPEQEIDCAIRIQAGDQNAVDELVQANLRFVISVAKQYMHAGNLMDLINEGNMGMIIAAKRFDHTRGFKFISYAVWWIRQSILKFLNDSNRIVRLPANKLQAITSMKKVTNDLRQDLGREPSKYEIEESFLAQPFAIKHSFKNIDEIMEADTRKLSLDYNMGENSGGGDELTLLDLISSEEDKPEPMFNNSAQIDINRFLVRLKYQEQYAIENFYGLNGKKEKTLEQIGEELELTRERIRQIKARAELKLRRVMMGKGLNEYL